MSKVLGRQELDAVGLTDLKVEEVPTPEWGGVVVARAINSADRQKYLDWRYEFRYEGNKRKIVETGIDYKAALFVLGAVDAAGNRLYTDKEINIVSAKNGLVVERVFEVIHRLSGLGEDAAKSAEGNSATTPPSGSSST